MKQLTKEVLEQYLEILSVDCTADSWDWRDSLCVLINHLEGADYLSYSAMYNEGEDQDVSICVGSDTPVGFATVIFLHELPAPPNNDMLLANLLQYEEKAKTLLTWLTSK